MQFSCSFQNWNCIFASAKVTIEVPQFFHVSIIVKIRFDSAQIELFSLVIILADFLQEYSKTPDNLGVVGIKLNSTPVALFSSIIILADFLQEFGIAAHYVS